MKATTSQGKLAVLSYHSWEVEPEALHADIEALRDQGWSSASLEEWFDLAIGGAKETGRYFLVASDDGSEKDTEFVATLDAVGCPGVLFVNAGNIEQHRDSFYRKLLRSGNVAVEDHGFFHRKHFVSSCVLDFVAPQMYLGGLEHLKLEEGMPLCVTGSEVTTRRFTPNPSAMDMAVELACSSSEGMGQAGWKLMIERTLVKEGLAYRRFGRTYLKGTFEERSEFEDRVTAYLADGRNAFASRFGRPPRYFAYPWWQGLRNVDGILEKLGYIGSFAGLGAFKAGVGRQFSIPRIPIGSGIPRPLRLNELSYTLQYEGAFVSSLKYHCKALLGIL